MSQKLISKMLSGKVVYSDKAVAAANGLLLYFFHSSYRYSFA